MGRKPGVTGTAMPPLVRSLRDTSVAMTEDRSKPSNALWLQYLEAPGCTVQFDEFVDHFSIVVSMAAATATVLVDIRTRERVVERAGDPVSRQRLGSLAFEIAARKDHFDFALGTSRSPYTEMPLSEHGPWSRMQLLAGASRGWWLPPAPLTGVDDPDEFRSAALRVNRFLRSTFSLGG